MKIKGLREFWWRWGEFYYICIELFLVINAGFFLLSCIFSNIKIPLLFYIPFFHLRSGDIPGGEDALQLVQNIQDAIILLGVKVTVSIPRLLDPRVPEARGDGLDIDVCVNQQACVAMPKIVDTDYR